jgi:multiple antibiotic resistance protein
MHWSDYTRFGIALFALISPILAIPYTLSVSAGGGPRAVNLVAMSATATMTVTLLVMHFLGESILLTLGTSLASFQIGGGLIILLSGLSMLRGETVQTVENEVRSMDRAHYLKLGVSPLGIPMLAGAGAITKVIIETHPEFGIEAEFGLSMVIVLVCALSGMLIAASSLLVRILGVPFFSIFARIAGLVIVAVAVEVMARGFHTQAGMMIAQ